MGGLHKPNCATVAGHLSLLASQDGGPSSTPCLPERLSTSSAILLRPQWMTATTFTFPGAGLGLDFSQPKKEWMAQLRSLGDLATPWNMTSDL